MNEVIRTLIFICDFLFQLDSWSPRNDFKNMENYRDYDEFDYMDNYQDYDDFAGNTQYHSKDHFQPEDAMSVQGGKMSF